MLLIDTDSRKPGIHRETRYEITPAELIAAIRAQGTGGCMPVFPGTAETRPDRA